MYYLVFYSLGLLILIPIIVGFYIDFKNNPNAFKLSLNSFVNRRSYKVLLAILIYVCFVKVYEYAIPLNKNNDLEFNATRIQLGIPIIGKNWKINESESTQFETCWTKSEQGSGHFKKIIEYGLWHAKTETDFFKYEKQEGTFVWSIYDFESQTFEYFVEKANDKILFVSEKGNLKYEKPTIVKKISKTDFENYTTK